MQRNNDFPSYSAKSPAFVVFMIDQTASMMNVSLGGGDRAEIAAINVQNAIIEILNRCISGINIKPRAYISVIGYGGQVGETAEIIREGWVNDWAEDIVKAKTNKECIFPIIANGAASMNEGFRLAEELCNNWENTLFVCFSFYNILSPIINPTFPNNLCSFTNLSTIAND